MDMEKGCRCGERLRAKAGGRRSLAHTRWLLVRAGEGVPNREREVNRRREVCECQEASECVCVSYRSTIDVQVDTKGCVLGEDVADLRFELGVKRQLGLGGTGPACVAHAQLLKLQKKVSRCLFIFPTSLGLVDNKNFSLGFSKFDFFHFPLSQV